MKVLKKSKGFTLVELIVVIAIIGILAAVLIPNLTGYIQKARKSSAEQDALSIYKEFIGTLDADKDQVLLDADYVVISGDYLVVIKRGGLHSSAEYEDYDDILGHLNSIDYNISEGPQFDLLTIPSDAKYFVIENEGLALTKYYR